MAYRLAKALIELRDDVNRAAPVRNRQSDGWIGDAAHASRSSDHNPWVKNGSMGVVTALDITNDPAHGVDGNVLSAALVKDPRVKYVIWNRRIYNRSRPGWRDYKGTNPHDHHVHVSVLAKKELYDNVAEWKTGLPVDTSGKALADPAPTHQTIKVGSQGGDVFELQRRLGVKVDGDFGPKTQAAVKKFQKEQGLTPDGVVGPYTWAALEKEKPLPTPLQGLVSTGETPAAGEAPSLPAAGTVSAEYGSPAWAVDFLQELGWSQVASIALTANLMWESGGNRQKKINWDAQGDKDAEEGQYHSHGAGQWNDRHGRWQNLMGFAEQRGKDWYDPETQLRFMDEELHTLERHTAVDLREAETVSEAVRIAVNYWRPGIPHTDRREKIAEALAKETGNVA